MNEKTIEEFIRANNDAVLSTFRKNGAVQLSIVTVGYYKGGACFTTTSDRAKFYNMKRDPRCSLLISGSDWRPYVVLEGTANIYFTDTNSYTNNMQYGVNVYDENYQNIPSSELLLNESFNIAMMYLYKPLLKILRRV